MPWLSVFLHFHSDENLTQSIWWLRFMLDIRHVGFSRHGWLFFCMIQIRLLELFWGWYIQFLIWFILYLSNPRRKFNTVVKASARVDKFSKSDIIVSPSILSANFAKLGDQVLVYFPAYPVTNAPSVPFITFFGHFFVIPLKWRDRISIRTHSFDFFFLLIFVMFTNFHGSSTISVTTLQSNLFLSQISKAFHPKVRVWFFILIR